ncbi:MAG: hypothetical protein RIF41_18525 [Polyangiaceae bacterium]
MANTDRLINPRGRKHYRRSYSMTEVRIGVVILLGLGGFAGWVAYMGAHPPDDLFANTPDLLDPGSAPIERGPLPEGLAAKGWKEGKLAAFDADNLYEKINGRAGYFTSKGFVGLLFLPLVSEDAKEDTIDVEVYDMGASENALGAYVGEKADEIASTEGTGVVWHRDRNALYMARGAYYIRAIGSQESPGVDRALAHLRETLEGGLAAGERPWAHALLVDALGVPATEIEYAKENAMSFEFAKNVYVARQGEDTELFVASATDDEAAVAMAKEYVAGFESYGEAVEGGDWIKDRYLGAFSAVRTAGPLVIGVRGATSLELGKAALAPLHKGAVELPVEVVEAAKAAARAEKPSSEVEPIPEESYPPSPEGGEEQ